MSANFSTKFGPAAEQNGKVKKGPSAKSKQVKFLHPLCQVVSLFFRRLVILTADVRTHV
jgi:hypothetical protein